MNLQAPAPPGCLTPCQGRSSHAQLHPLCDRFAKSCITSVKPSLLLPSPEAKSTPSSAFPSWTQNYVTRILYDGGNFFFIPISAFPMAWLVPTRCSVNTCGESSRPLGFTAGNQSVTFSGKAMKEFVLALGHSD